MHAHTHTHIQSTNHSVNGKQSLALILDIITWIGVRVSVANYTNNIALLLPKDA
jgi:hypothetical protein